ncbi:hypothetical protein F444_09674 [Phytophthora nicotianae P1976]|uniref:Uncharacterized protein n=1 Tax=Phytophthora nicotianae P1976 TaxID=1317066 RepID=A0A081A711_PHYNI|nr:hypothetical protein F444_09674 [Phytophthora nicotianae P1976]
MESNRRKELKKVRQFAYEKFTDSTPGSVKKKVRTRSERYREAVRVTHLIASEMADIEDEAEFEDMLKFVMNKWRNVRQKKVAIENETTTASGLERISQSRRFTDTDVKTEFGIDSSDEEDTNTGSAKDESTKDKPADASSNVSIRLNPKWERPRRRERKLLKERKLIEKGTKLLRKAE